MLKVEIAATGNELISGQITDTNSSWLAEQLRITGARVDRIHAVGDEIPALGSLLREIASRADLAVVTGGLGSTTDDVTARAAAECSGRKLIADPEAKRSVAGTPRHRPDSRSARTEVEQALIPEKSLVLPNPLGTAPGFGLSLNGCLFFFLPGVPREMKRMAEDSLLPRIRSDFETRLRPVLTKRLTIFGLTESGISERLGEFQRLYPSVGLGYRFNFPRIQLGLSADQAQTSQEELDRAKRWVLKKLGTNVVSAADETLADVVGRLLREKGATLSLAESCTGGLLSRRITGVAGSSDYFSLSAVTYSNRSKMEILGVREATLQQHGAVHEETAVEMAEGIRRLAGSTFALSTTGVAGPGGGSPDKPVGTVCIGLASPEDSTSRRIQWDSGDRQANQSFFAECAMDLLRRRSLLD
jgi:nicotinamide-nucleotide amidase